MANLEGLAQLSTAVLAIMTIVGVFVAIKNINVLRDQHRRNTFLSLMSDLSSASVRRSRDIVNICMEPDTNGKYLVDIPPYEIWSLPPPYIGQQIGVADVTTAIEDTVNCMDKVGFFLLRVDPRLKDEAPIWIWTITNEMWSKLGSYVKNRQLSHYGWGRYFEDLFNESARKGHYAHLDTLISATKKRTGVTP